MSSITSTSIKEKEILDLKECNFYVLKSQFNTRLNTLERESLLTVAETSTWKHGE